MMDKIRRMNQMYDLPISEVPVCPGLRNLTNFKSILKDEVKEIGDVIVEDDRIDRIVAFADLLADIIVYCKSEALKFGIPIDEVFNIVMESNFSKLGEDGKPIKDERGKFLKGPNYWKPEPKIKELILERIKQGDQFNTWRCK